jgi:alkanesulfonate monooxygenase SsuD/methylene tetrahydromethanopterin reductase-like flavin-dependent oxidoreductase (luciferase family)
MILMYFTERPYRYVPEDEVIRHGGFFGLPNKFFDRDKAVQLYDEYLKEAVYAEEMGFDAIMLNEHHGTPFCMGAVMNVEAAILARITQKVRIVLLGNPLPTFKNPLRVAEELATIDCISRGRLVPGWVRGAGSEQVFNNANPAYNRELFNEAHDLILAAWTRPGPFRWEGTHFTYRYVNPWVTPYQKPRPPIWIPGVLSPETVRWCAEHRYPYLGLGTSLRETVELWNLYGDTAANAGYIAGSENFGYVNHVFVAETEEKAEELGKCHLFGGGQVNFSRPEHTLPPGYNSKEATRRLARSSAAQSGTAFLGVSAEQLGRAQQPASAPRKTSTKQRLQRGEATIDEARAAIYGRYPKTVKSMAVVSGTPRTVLPKIRRILETLRPSVFGFFATQGPVSFADRMTNIRLLGQEVLPAVREYGKELGLLDPFEREPGSRPYTPGTQRDPLVTVKAPRAAAN